MGRCYFRRLDILLCKIGKPNMWQPFFFFFSGFQVTMRETLCTGIMDLDGKAQVFHLCFCKASKWSPKSCRFHVLYIDTIVS